MTLHALAGLRRLEWRLPAMISGLLVLVVAAVSWVAYGMLRQTTVDAAGARVERVAAQLASMLGDDVEGFLSRSAMAATDGRLRAALASDAPAATESARVLLDSLAAVGGQILRVELYDAARRRVAIGRAPTDEAGSPPGEPAFEDDGPAARVSGFRPYGGALAYAVAVPVPDEAEPAGTLVYHFMLTGSGDDAARITDLVGAGASRRLGVPGGVWTDLAGQVDPPPAAVARAEGAARYRLSSGEDVLGAGAPVPGTPWTARIEFPEAAVLAPARTALARMIPLGGVIVLLGAVIGWMFGRGITNRLVRLTEAVTTVAAGGERRPLPDRGTDELAEVARAFNLMAAEVEGARSRLEEMVARRTEALAESEERFRTLATVAPDAIVTADTAGRITYANPGAERIFGYGADELIGSPLARLLPEPFSGPWGGNGGPRGDGEPHDVLQTTPEHDRRVELAARRADGSEFPVELSVSTDAARPGLAFTGLIRDITRRRTAEEALERYASSLEVSNRELDAFSYSVSHDLRAPLRAVHGFSLAVLEEHGDLLPERGREDLRRVCAAADHLSRLIDDLLELSRATRAEMRLEAVDLGAMARHIVAELSSEAPERSVEVRIGSELNARGDRRLLDHVLRNLLGNAWKFTSRKAHATIEVGRMVDEDGAFFVRDDGAGFDPRYAAKLFHPFQRLHAPRDFDGTGIGLALVARIVQRHGGRVAAEGGIDQGATFSFTLPGS